VLSEGLASNPSFSKRDVLIPKLQLGNADLEAPASSLAKLEIRLRGSQAGALIVIHKCLPEFGSLCNSRRSGFA